MNRRLRRLALPTGIALLAVLLVLGISTEARKNGVSGRTESGCTCHGGGSSDTSIIPKLDGAPGQYEPGKKYSLTVSVSGGPPYAKGGFDLNASAGKFSVPSGESNVQITTKDSFGGVAGEATHKTPNSRTWKVDWTAPSAGTGKVRFRLATNSVNGNDQPDALDKWNLLTKTSDEKNFAPKPVQLGPPNQAGPGRVQLTWSGTLDPDVARIEVHKGTKAGFALTSASKTESLTNLTLAATNVSNLAPNVTYYFRLRVVDKGGLSADSNEASLRVAYVAPSSPAASPTGDREVHDSPPVSPGPVLVVLALVAAILHRRSAARDDGPRKRETP